MSGNNRPPGIPVLLPDDLDGSNFQCSLATPNLDLAPGHAVWGHHACGSAPTRLPLPSNPIDFGTACLIRPFDLRDVFNERR